MELACDEFVGSNNDHSATNSHLIVKGKRTKRRHRASSPNPALAAAVTSSSSTAGGGVGEGEDEYASLSSPTTTSSSSAATAATTTEEEEEEDMANCLILLAQGDHAPTRQIPKLGGTSSTSAAAAAAVGKSGFLVYECKTCNRTFPSFQALGGHRASHKKPRTGAAASSSPATAEDYKKASPPPPIANNCSIPAADEFGEHVLVFNKVTGTSSTPSPPPSQPHAINPLLPLQIAHAKALIQSGKGKIHECSICGSEFTSGQALGGHMRRHRASSSSSSSSSSAPIVNAQSFEVVVGTNTTTTTTTTAITTSTSTTRLSSMDKMKRRDILGLDLNLPAPEDDHHHHHHNRESSKFQFVRPTQQPPVFSAPTLVDCHY